MSLIRATACPADMELDTVESILDLTPAHHAGLKEGAAGMDAQEGLLQQHMAAAAQLPPPSMSQAAAAMLQQYYKVHVPPAMPASAERLFYAYTYICPVGCMPQQRMQSSAGGTPFEDGNTRTNRREVVPSAMQALRQHDGGEDVRPGAMGMLAKLATACARLHLRSTVLVMPDAMQAILIFEASSEAKVTEAAGRAFFVLLCMLCWLGVQAKCQPVYAAFPEVWR